MRLCRCKCACGNVGGGGGAEGMPSFPIAPITVPKFCGDADAVADDVELDCGAAGQRGSGGAVSGQERGLPTNAHRRAKCQPGTIRHRRGRGE